MDNRVRTAKISIDIGRISVKIIETNKNGIIVKAGAAEVPGGISYESGAEYADALSLAIRSAAKDAQISGGKCVIVVGDPRIIVRTFTLPNMPPEALKLNAEAEIAPYLPSEAEQFSVDYKVLGQKTSESANSDSSILPLDVLVAAMPKKLAALLLSATAKAGFSTKHIGIRENARGKLTRQNMPDSKQSFAILDISDVLVNISIFINGTYYASRYFASSSETASAAVTITNVNVDNAGQPEMDGIPDEYSSALIDADNLINEVVSIIDYIHYRERNSKVGSILIFGSEDKIPYFSQSLFEALEIPAFYLAKKLEADISNFKYEQKDISDYLDAYGAALMPSTKSLSDIDLSLKKETSYIPSRFILPAAYSMLILCCIFLAGVFYTSSTIRSLEYQERLLDEELSRYTISESDIEALTKEIDVMAKTKDEVAAFYNGYPMASDVLRAIYNSKPSGTATGIEKVAIADGTVSLKSSTTALDKAAQMIVTLRENMLIVDERAQIAKSHSNQTENGFVEFEVVLNLVNGMDGVDGIGETGDDMDGIVIDILKDMEVAN